MIKRQMVKGTEVAEEDEWVTFPGGELEGHPPKVMCPTCREKLRREARLSHAGLDRPRPSTLCFECYRTDLARARALRAARERCEGQEAPAGWNLAERFQASLPIEPVNRPRLERLRAERADARSTAQAGAGRFVDKRRHAQIAARHALERIAAALQSRGDLPEHHPALADAIHAAELQLPDAWRPFVVSR